MVFQSFTKMTFTAVTKGIKVSVGVKYEGFITKHQKYAFSYQILIENNSSYTVQLLRRHWFISDSNGQKREVEGVGVIGEQPIIEPNQKHQYSSWCPLDTDMGEMYGAYLMERSFDGQLFKAKVPLFKFIVPERLN